MERAIGIEPTTFSLGSCLVSKPLNPIATKPVTLHLNRTKQLRAISKTHLWPQVHSELA